MVAVASNLDAQLQDWVAGRITLKELGGFHDDELFAIAHTGYFYIKQGKHEEARKVFEGLVALEPSNDYYYRALGVVFESLGEYERAERQFSYAIRVNPTSPYAYVNRAEVQILLGKSDAALADLQLALDRISFRDQNLANKAWALLKAINQPK